MAAAARQDTRNGGTTKTPAHKCIFIFLFYCSRKEYSSIKRGPQEELNYNTKLEERKKDKKEGTILCLYVKEEEEEDCGKRGSG